jgi:2-polyprenyl-3-methyl-5-hydroxy-6-metoxy-1,4-benzoquinol methylase
MSDNKYYGQILTSDNLLEIRLRHFPNHEDLEILLGFLEDRETVLDLGCGTGFTCEFLAKCGKNVTGVEPTEEYIIGAKRRVQDLDFAGRLNFQIGDRAIFYMLTPSWRAISVIVNISYEGGKT